MLENPKFDIEHAICMYANSFATLPAFALYDDDSLSSWKQIIEKCHIYIIGYVPELVFKTANHINSKLILEYSIKTNETTSLEYDVPPGYSLNQTDSVFFLKNEEGKTIWPSLNDQQLRLKLKGQRTFDVQYIGQSYGKSGSSNALDRLRKHETLQKIALSKAPTGYDIQLLLLEVEPNNRLVTTFQPNPQIKGKSDTRINSGLEKLFNTTEEERISLFEASLIRYFYPKYNKVYKNSFPSTQLKILKDCYDKDFLAVVSEICIDKLPFELMSDVIKPIPNHICIHDLQNDEKRCAFFSDVK